MLKKFIVFIIFLLVFFYHPLKKPKAASMNLSNPNVEKISGFEEIYSLKVDLSINASDETKYYLRGMFYKKDTNKYCGYTWNGKDWFKGPYSSNEGWKNLQAITVSSDSASLDFKAKLDSGDSDCNSPGEYNFKIQRYTEGGSSSIDDQNPQKVIVEVKEVSPTPKPTVYKTPSLITNKANSGPSVANPPSNTVTVKKVLPTLTDISQTFNSNSSKFSVPSISKSDSVVEGSSTVAGMKKSGFSPAFIFLFLGIGFIFAASLASFKKLSAGK